MTSLCLVEVEFFKKHVRILQSLSFAHKQNSKVFLSDDTPELPRCDKGDPIVHPPDHILVADAVTQCTAMFRVYRDLPVKNRDCMGVARICAVRCTHKRIVSSSGVNVK